MTLRVVAAARPRGAPPALFPFPARAVAVLSDSFDQFILLESIMQSDPFKKMIHALKNFRERHGHPAMRALLEALAGVTAAKKVPREKYDLITAAAKGQIDCVEEIRTQIKKDKKVQVRALAALNDDDEESESESESESEDDEPKSAPTLDATRKKAFAKMAAKSAAPKLDKAHARAFANMHSKATKK